MQPRVPRRFDRITELKHQRLFGLMHGIGPVVSDQPQQDDHDTDYDQHAAFHWVPPWARFCISGNGR